MLTLNLVANAIIFVATFWALYTQKVPTRTGGSIVLATVAFAAFGNMTASNVCHSDPEVMLNAAVALGFLWGVWRLELRHLIYRGHA